MLFASSNICRPHIYQQSCHWDILNTGEAADFKDQKNLNFRPPYPFFPPFLRDSAGVLGGEGERLLFLLAELALRSLRSGVREDWSDKPRAAQGARDGGWEKEPQNERMERLHTQGGEAVERLGGGREGGRRDAVAVEETNRVSVYGLIKTTPNSQRGLFCFCQIKWKHWSECQLA